MTTTTRPRRLLRPLHCLALLVLVGGCAGLPVPGSGPAGGPNGPGSSNGPTGPSGTVPAPVVPGPGGGPPAGQTPPPIVPYDQAVLSAATALLGNAKLPPERTAASARPVIVIDPLIDGMTGAQSVTTRAMGERLAALIRERYPQFDVQPFNAASVARNPLVLIGTFTGVNAQRQTSGVREAYRICYALLDFQSGRIVSKGLAFSQTEGVNPAPLPAFADAPAWSEDPATLGYIRTCQGTRAGDPINPLYLDRIMSAALVAEATEAYDAGRYREALELYQSAQRSGAGDQFRVYNGLYLANWKLGRRDRAEAAFAQIVDFGLAQKRLAVKFLFRPGSTAFTADARTAGAYPFWIRTIGSRAATMQSCLEIAGHTSPTGPEPLNERLSLLRAESVQSQLEAAAPALAGRTLARGVGSKEAMVGNRRDDTSDAIDRRVEFKVIGCKSS